MSFFKASTPIWTCELHPNDEIHRHPQEPVANAPPTILSFHNLYIFQYAEEDTSISGIWNWKLEGYWESWNMFVIKYRVFAKYGVNEVISSQIYVYIYIIFVYVYNIYISFYYI